MRGTEPIASSEEAARRPPEPHPRATRDAEKFGVAPRTFWRSRCATCGETAYGLTPRLADLALAELNCLPVEKAWNDRMYGRSRNGHRVA